IDPRDPPALLLLAGVYRHTGRGEAAAAALDQLDRMEAAEPWWLERRSERARLARSLGVASDASAEGEKDSEATEAETEEQRPASAPPLVAANDAADGASPPRGASVGASEQVVAEATDQLIAAEMAALRE